MEDPATENRQRSIAVAVLAIEFMALLIGLAMPITPSKTGSDFSLAEWFFDGPTYLQEVLVYFLLTNALIGAILLVAWLWARWSRPEDNQSEI